MEQRSQGLSFLHVNGSPGCHSPLSNPSHLGFCSQNIRAALCKKDSDTMRKNELHETKKGNLRLFLH
jgi:hypothetical protein